MSHHPFANRQPIVTGKSAVEIKEIWGASPDSRWRDEERRKEGVQREDDILRTEIREEGGFRREGNQWVVIQREVIQRGRSKGVRFKWGIRRDGGIQGG